jgi:hypothetical protein
MPWTRNMHDDTDSYISFSVLCSVTPFSIAKADAAKLKHVSAPSESPALVQSKVLLGVTGKHELKHVDAPTGGLSQAQKEAFINKVKDEEA